MTTVVNPPPGNHVPDVWREGGAVNAVKLSEWVVATLSSMVMNSLMNNSERDMENVGG